MSKYKLSKSGLGERFRELRLQEKLPLRKVAALLDIDVAILSKLERGERRLTKEMVRKLAEIYHQELEPLMIQYLSERVLYEIGDEELGRHALQAADVSILYGLNTIDTKENIISKIAKFLKADQRVCMAWVFGSFARGDMNAQSDIDLMVQFDEQKKVSLFDIAEIVHELENVVRRKIDMVEEGNVLPFALETAKKDMIKIYG